MVSNEISGTKAENVYLAFQIANSDISSTLLLNSLVERSLVSAAGLSTTQQKQYSDGEFPGKRGSYPIDITLSGNHGGGGGGEAGSKFSNYLVVTVLAPHAWFVFVWVLCSNYLSKII